MTTSMRMPPPLGHVNATFDNPRLSAGVGNHQLSFPVSIAATGLSAAPPNIESATVLVTGEVWTETPTSKWLAGLQPQLLTVYGDPSNKQLVLSLSNEQLVSLEHARGEGDIDLRLDIQVALLSTPEGVSQAVIAQVALRIYSADWLQLLD